MADNLKDHFGGTVVVTLTSNFAGVPIKQEGFIVAETSAGIVLQKGTEPIFLSFTAIVAIEWR